MLLELPRELRDMIWKFALTAEHGLTAHPNDDGEVVFCSSRSTLTEKAIEFDQLRYANKQLREETEGLVFKLNYLYFFGTDDAIGVSFAKKCLQRCAPSVKVHIRKLIIHYYAPSMGDRNYITMADVAIELRPSSVLAEFCTKYPMAQVMVRFLYLELVAGYTTSMWLELYHTHQPAVRGCSMMPLRKNFCDHWQTTHSDYAVSHVNTMLLPATLRFTLSQEFLINGMRSGGRWALGDDAMNRVAVAARTLFKEGI